MQSIRKKSFAAEQLARQREKKNPTTIAVIVLAVVIAVGAVGYALFVRYGEKEEPTEVIAPTVKEIESIAVLPFKNLSADPEQEYFCDGIADEIINNLQHIGTLKVIARTSSFAYKGQDIDIREIGRELDVDAVFEGSVTKYGDRLRIIAQLVNVSDGSHFFSEPYTYEMADLLDIRIDLSMKIVEALKITLLGEEKAAIEKRYTYNIEANQQYYMGRHFLNKRTKDSIKTSLEYFQKAIRKDQNFALAYAGMADSYNLLGIWGYMLPREAFRQAKEAAHKALFMDDTIAEAHTSLGFACMVYDWDWDTAEKRFKQAIKLKPTYALAHKWFAEYLKFTGNFDEAIREFRKALDCDPLYLQTYINFADLYLSMGNYEKALYECQKAIEIDKNFAPSYSMMGYTFANMNNYQEAINNFKKALELSSEFGFAKTGLGYTYAKAGNKEDAERLLKSLIDQKHREYISSYRIALIYLGLGELNNALSLLKQSHEERDPSFIYINEQIWDPLRTDPRFQELYQKIGFPEQ